MAAGAAQMTDTEVDWRILGSAWPRRDRRSALDAVELMNVGWNYRREHMRLQQRSHYVISNGGDQPNVVPSEASVWYYFRETTYPRIADMLEAGQTMAAAAAIAGHFVDIREW